MDAKGKQDALALTYDFLKNEIHGAKHMEQGELE